MTTTAHIMPAALEAGAISTALATTGAAKVILVNASFTLDLTATSWATVTHECSGGDYARVNLDTIAVVKNGTDVVWTAHPTTVGRPSDAPAGVLIERTSDHLPLVYLPLTDDASDPVVVTWVDGIVATQHYDVDTTGVRLAQLDDCTGLVSIGDGQVPTFDAETGSWVPGDLPTVPSDGLTFAVSTKEPVADLAGAAAFMVGLGMASGSQLLRYDVDDPTVAVAWRLNAEGVLDSVASPLTVDHVNTTVSSGLDFDFGAGEWVVGYAGTGPTDFALKRTPASMIPDASLIDRLGRIEVASAAIVPGVLSPTWCVSSAVGGDFDVDAIPSPILDPHIFDPESTDPGTYNLPMGPSGDGVYADDVLVYGVTDVTKRGLYRTRVSDGALVLRRQAYLLMTVFASREVFVDGTRSDGPVMFGADDSIAFFRSPFSAP